MAQAGIANYGTKEASSGRSGCRRCRNRMNTIMLFVTGCMMAAFLFVYIGQLTVISAASKEARQLRQEISQLHEEQEQLQINLANRQNIDRVWDVATGELGMRYPVEGQVQIVSMNGYSSSAATQTAHDNANP